MEIRAVLEDDRRPRSTYAAMGIYLLQSILFVATMLAQAVVMFTAEKGVVREAEEERLVGY